MLWLKVGNKRQLTASWVVNRLASLRLACKTNRVLSPCTNLWREKRKEIPATCHLLCRFIKKKKNPVARRSPFTVNTRVSFTRSGEHFHVWSFQAHDQVPRQPLCTHLGIWQPGNVFCCKVRFAWKPIIPVKFCELVKQKLSRWDGSLLATMLFLRVTQEKPASHCVF